MPMRNFLRTEYFRHTVSITQRFLLLERDQRNLGHISGAPKTGNSKCFVLNYYSPHRNYLHNMKNFVKYHIHRCTYTMIDEV
jgi:hypothetical protein